MSLQAGARIGAYEIVSLLGAGGMGEVYRARDTRLKRDVAIKIVPESLAADPIARGRFETEARAVASLSHPNIIAIHDFGVDGTTAYAVMELLDGRTLRELLADGPLPSRKAIDYGAQIAAGLAAAHARGVVHRDLKPENVFVTRDGRAKILDFGLAKPMAHLASTQGTLAATYTPTSPGTVLGTVGYMSPEQVRGEAVDHRSDIFALGAILYESFSGKRAFSGPSAVETMNAILKEEPPELAISNLPPAIDRIVRRALEKDPDERFQSARDLGFALEALTGATASGSTGATSSTPPAARAPWRRRLAGIAVPAAIAIVALAIGAAGGRWTAQPASGPPMTFEPKTFDDLTVWNARFIGTDKTIVYSASLEGGTPELFLSRPNQLGPQRLGLSRTHLLSVSSKGELAVLTDAVGLGQRLFEGTLARMPLEGAPRPWMQHVREADWSPDGSTLAIIRDAGTSDVLEYPIGTQIHTASGYLSDVRVSPDGNHVAFLEHPARYDDRGYVKVWDRGGGVRTLAGDYWGEESLAWKPDGRAVYYAAAADEPNYTLRSVAISGTGQPRVELSSPDSIYVFDIAPDGTQLLARNDSRGSMRVRRPGEAREREMSSFDNAWGARLSPDGSMVVFTDGSVSAGSSYAVAIRKTDGSPTVRLGAGGDARLSPDGTRALARIYDGPASRLVIYPTGPGEPISLNTSPLTKVDPAGWMPDGRRVVMCGSEPNQPRRCYSQDLQGGTPVPLTPAGYATDAAVFSPDGQMLLVRKPNEGLQVLSLRDGSLRPVAGSTPADTALGWSTDARAIFVLPAGAAMSIDRLDLTTGQRTPQHRFELSGRPGMLGSNGVSISRDGTGYAYAYISQLSRLFLVRGAKN